MKKLLIIMLFLVGSCASNPTKNTEPFDEESYLKIKNKILEDLDVCRIDNVIKFDDGVSDARTIAIAANKSCIHIYDAYISHHFNHPKATNMKKYYGFESTINKTRKEFINNDEKTLQYVLVYRSAKSN